MRLVNNIFFNVTATQECVKEYGTGHPSELRNNLFFGCAYYQSFADVNDKTKTKVTGADSGNITVADFAAVKFVSATDWHLTSATPQGIRQGGVERLLARVGLTDPLALFARPFAWPC